MKKKTLNATFDANNKFCKSVILNFGWKHKQDDIRHYLYLPSITTSGDF